MAAHHDHEGQVERGPDRESAAEIGRGMVMMVVVIVMRGHSDGS
jgi:hypothetical protein